MAKTVHTHEQEEAVVPIDLEEQNGHHAADTRHQQQQHLDAVGGGEGANGVNGFGSVGLTSSTPTKNAEDYFHPNQPVSLSWRHIHYSVPLKKKKQKVILQDCGGHLDSGKMLAILGPSGSGKTSLLSVLAGRAPTGGTLSGEITLNGYPRDSSFSLLSGYVIQDDALFHTLSVRETMLIAAELRLPSKISSKRKQDVADKVINELGLRKAADTYIGNQFLRGVSGGERKRVTLGIEMMGNPALIFLDEPTSGLDSFQSQNVVQSLKDLALNGRTVIMTIHQPRSSIFQMFDNIMLLSEGKPMYFGSSDAAIEYFNRLGWSCPSHFNPADFYLDLISLDTRSQELESSTTKRIDMLAAHYKKHLQPSFDESFESSHHRSLSHRSAGEGEEGGDGGGEKKKSTMAISKNATDYRASEFYQFEILFKRALIQISRDKIPMIIGVGTAIFFSLIVGMLYTEMDKSQKGIQDRMGALFFVVVNNAFGQMFAILNVFTTEKLIVQREMSARAYRVWPYYMSKVIAEVPFRLIGPFVFCLIAYPLIGFNPEKERFFMFIAIVLLLAMASQTLGIFLGSLSKNEDIAMNISPLATVILLLFGGFYVNSDTIPLAASWVKYISHIHWAFTALCINEFEGQTGWNCDGFETIDVSSDSSTSSSSEDAANTNCAVSGEQILHRLSMDDTPVWEPIVCQAALILGLHFLSYLSLLLLQPKFLPLELSTSVKKRKPSH